MLNYPVLIDHKRGAITEALRFVENSIILHHCSFEIAEERECYSNVLREAFVGGNAIYTDAENLRVGSFEFGDISLIRLQLFRSTAGKGQDVEGKHYVLLAFEIAQLHFLAGSAGKRKIRGSIAYFQIGLGW